MTRNTISTWAAKCLLVGLLLSGSALAQTQFVLIPYEGLVIVVDILTPRNLTVTGLENGDIEFNWNAPNPSPDLTYEVEYYRTRCDELLKERDRLKATIYN